ncbi:MAG TPA: hypothetical protein VFM02_03785 [Candidatus Paceibacterota bacterium]|nr:hypothetical protein [Candidatus Paceibacterota bacterium]
MIDFRFKDTALVSEDELVMTSHRLFPYTERLKILSENGGYGEPEASLNLLFDGALLQSVREASAKLRDPRLKYIVLVGIGGSNLGTEAIYDALLDRKKICTPGNPGILFLDTVDSVRANAVCETLLECESAEEFVLLVVSKSGKTTETAANAAFLYNTLSERFSDLNARVACITDEGSALWKLAEEKNFLTLSIPKNVGGRYSVFSAVGLLPLSLAGIDIEKVLAGAKQIRKECLFSNAHNNPALLSAVVKYCQFKKGARVHNLFLFDSSLAVFGSWWRQLVGESLGKEFDLNSNPINDRILPMVSLGSTDLHSVGQLYLSGEKSIFTTFVSLEKKREEIPTLSDSSFTPLVPEIRGKDFSNIMEAILKGVKEAYRKRSLPFAEISLPEISEENIGALFQMEMLSTMYLAFLMNVNAFDQPNVEEYKKITREILEK